MQQTGKVINFRWERFKHRFKVIMTCIRRFFKKVFNRKIKDTYGKKYKNNHKGNKKIKGTKKS